ncbi:hypothetical protein QFZ42_000175 [Variovorax paradoxus]|uniref:hypothetical protein n=1 Tax=Variovorax paradoxus TaxID=34073 RepID=UPI00278F1711|nr:hypothetical protein [Variovorax paradoxus]MDQ0568341.1 hypothetical protein [Variovorax paradoxus]
MLKTRRYVFFILGLLAQSAWAESFEYSSLLTQRPIITIQTDPPLVASGDRAVEARFCNEQQFHCVRSDWFNFSIPKHRSANQAEWNYGGFVYRLVDASPIRALGVCLEASKIVSLQNDREVQFFFSDSHGLLGFSIPIEGTSAAYVSEREFGFGSTKSDKAKAALTKKPGGPPNHKLPSACT